ncbi:MAG: hypothetical protein JXR96_20440 [Deltaproteobacteria bacterium]|nr:hypothetical protein [Deltaproteobacteria bacterium]
MRTLLLVCMLALITASSAACGGGGPSCQSLCNKMRSCEPTMEMSDCLEGCGQYKQYMRSNVFDTLANCFMDHSCEEIGLDGDMCFEAAIAAGNTAAADRMIADVCDKLVECESYPDKQECIDSANEDEDFKATAGMFKDSVLDCFVNCIKGKSCDELTSDETIEECMESCGLQA